MAMPASKVFAVSHLAPESAVDHALSISLASISSQSAAVFLLDATTVPRLSIHQTGEGRPRRSRLAFLDSD